jgi:hypothetical protein
MRSRIRHAPSIVNPIRAQNPTDSCDCRNKSRRPSFADGLDKYKPVLFLKVDHHITSMILKPARRSVR